VSSRKVQKQSNRVVREQLAAERRRKRNMLVTIIAVFAVVLAGLIGFGIYETQKPKNINVPKTAIDSGHGIPVSSGPVTVDVYVDLLCPICKNFETTAGPTLDQMVKDNKIKLVYHPIAILDHNTNPAGYSTRAGSATGCAADFGKFYDFLKAMYADCPWGCSWVWGTCAGPPLRRLRTMPPRPLPPTTGSPSPGSARRCPA
jgi:protein-disulfide isomerase